MIRTDADGAPLHLPGEGAQDEDTRCVICGGDALPHDTICLVCAREELSAEAATEALRRWLHRHWQDRWGGRQD